MHAFTVVLTDLNCGDSGKGVMFISNVRRLRHWMSGRGILFFGCKRCCRVVCCCWKARMTRNVSSIPKIVPMSSTHWGYSSSWIGHCARRSSMLCMWREEMSGYYALIWSVSTLLAHGILEVIIDFSIIWIMELFSLSSIFGVWCFHQLYSMILYGFHHLMCVQMENEELWPRDAIKHEMVDETHIAPTLQFLGMTFTTLVNCGAIFHYPCPLDWHLS